MSIPTTPFNATVIFCRIVGVTDDVACGVGDKFRRLRELMLHELDLHKPPITVRSPQRDPCFSPFGLFILVDCLPWDALSLASSIKARADGSGVQIGMGIARGEVKPRSDIDGGNFVGIPINLAARMASAKHGDLRIAVESAIVQDVKQTSDTYKFSPKQDTPVKGTELDYHFLNPPLQGAKPRQNSIASVHVIVYDIVGYSKLSQDIAWRATTILTDWVTTFIQQQSLNPDDYIIGPAGDGGAIAFRPNLGARTGAQLAFSLARHIIVKLSKNNADSFQVRVGVTDGIVDIYETHPVGDAVFRADKLCAAADPNGIVVTNKYWYQNNLDAADTNGLSIKRSSETGEDLVLLSP